MGSQPGSSSAASEPAATAAPDVPRPRGSRRAGRKRAVGAARRKGFAPAGRPSLARALRAAIARGQRALGRGAEAAIALGQRALGRGAEAAIALAVSLAGAAAILGPHVAAGGRYLDDWWLGAYIRYPSELGFASALDYLSFYSGARPGAVLYWLATYDVFGFHDGWHRGASVALAGGLAAAFYLLLRELRLGPVDAAAIALLSLALPVADSIRFWITPAVSQLCVAACVVGFALALRALRASGRRAAALHAVSLACFALSLVLAETMLPVIALSLLVYRTQVTWRAATARWAADLALAGAALIHYALNTRTRLLDLAPDVSAVDRARTLADQLVTLLTSTLAPFAATRTWVLVAIAGVVALAALRARPRRGPAAAGGGTPDAHGTRVPREARESSAPSTLTAPPSNAQGTRVPRRARGGGGASAADARRLLVIAGLAAIFAAASYVIYVPADPSYVPLAPGTGNRVNVGALLPLAVLAYALVRLAGGAVPGRRPRAAVTLVLFAAVLATALDRLRDDRELWAAAAAQQERVLASLHAALPSPPRDASLLVLGAPGVVTRFARVGHADVNQPVPVFSTWWELDVAAKLSYGRPDVAAYPIWSRQPPQLVCGAHDVYQLGLDGVRHALAYGRVFAVDVAARKAVRIDGPGQCARVTGDGKTIPYDLPA